MPNRSQVKGRVKEIRGKLEQATGTVAGDKEAKARGRARQEQGKVERIAGDLREKALDLAGRVVDEVDDHRGKNRRSRS